MTKTAAEELRDLFGGRARMIEIDASADIFAVRVPQLINHGTRWQTTTLVDELNARRILAARGKYHYHYRRAS